MLKGIRYFGGKARPGLNKWIRSILPDDRSVTYVEPYAGMLGILLNRPRATTEIANDLNGRIVNWWRMIRDHPDEFARRIALTPFADDLYEEAIANLDDGSPMARAVNLHIAVSQSIMHGDGMTGGGRMRTKYVQEGRSRYTEIRSFTDCIPILADRMLGVQLLNRPALELLERLINEDRAVIYCDPPYRDVSSHAYSVVEIDRDRMLDVLSRQSGKVAISGYGDEWDALEWHRSEFGTTAWIPKAERMESASRTEVLWTNYRPDQQITF